MSNRSGRGSTNSAAIHGPTSASGYYISGALTKAGVGSCIKISSANYRGGGSSDVLLDCGMFR